MVIASGCPQDNENPLSYARLDGEWAIWSEIAHWFERKVPTQDRGDIRHSITRLLSAYNDGRFPKNGVATIWIITEADRSATTILFLDEY